MSNASNVCEEDKHWISAPDDYQLRAPHRFLPEQRPESEARKNEQAPALNDRHERKRPNNEQWDEKPKRPRKVTQSGKSNEWRGEIHLLAAQRFQSTNRRNSASTWHRAVIAGFVAVEWLRRQFSFANNDDMVSCE
jgi:hypothetical protein